MPFTFSIISLANISDPNEALDVSFNTDSNGGSASLGETLSFSSAGDVEATITGTALGDDNNSKLASPITLNNTTYPANTTIETDYSFITFDSASGLYFRVSHISIDNQLVGAVVSKGFDLNSETYPEVYTPGNSLEMINPDTVPSNPGWVEFTRGENFNTGADQLYDNDIDLFDEPGNFICFAAPTWVKLADGRSKAASEIEVDDMVLTGNGTPKPVAWVGRKHFSEAALAARPKMRPILIRAGALGGGLPERDLRVSRQHRMLVTSSIAERMFGVRSVLVAAIRLIELPGVEIDEDSTSVDYIHFLFEDHELVYAEGALSESLYTGEEALRSVSHESRAEILSIFPELEVAPTRSPVAFIPDNRRQKRLIARHCKNGRPLQSASLPAPSHELPAYAAR